MAQLQGVWTLDQPTVNFVANSVCNAYAVFEKCPGQGIKQGVKGTIPVSDEGRKLAIDEILKKDPNLQNVNPIFIYETWPNGRPDWAKKPWVANQYTSGFQLFGYAATARDAGGRLRNICVYRGTVTYSEITASVDDTDWKNTVDLVLPRNEIIRDNNQPRTTYGKIKKTLWEWYGPKWQYSDAPTFVASLADSTRTAVMTVKAATSPDTPWLFTGHSLGGGLATLAAFESRDPNVVAGNAQPLLKVAPTVITFGSVLVGDQNFAAAYNAKINTHCRVENLCDWVPALQGLNILAADSDPTGARVAAYVPVGTQWCFAWQRYSIWGNHNMTAVYRNMTDAARFPRINKTGFIINPAAPPMITQ